MSGIRARLAGDLESQYDNVVAVLMDAMESTRKAWAYCPSCRRKVQVDHPDHNARVRAVELWLEQGFGRPGSGAAPDSGVTLGARETLADLKAMTMEQLAALIWSSQSKEQRERQRRFVDQVTAITWPPGFAAALHELDELTNGNRD